MFRSPSTTLVARRATGFALVELLLALTLGSVLLIALADAAHMLGLQVEDLRDEVDHSGDDALAEMQAAVRRAWWVDADATSLRVADPFGNITEYALENNALVVRRPGGEEGELVSDVTGITLDVQTTQRLREDTPLNSAGTWWTAAAPGSPDTLDLDDGDEVALGFTVSPAAPASVNTVSGVDEQLVQANLDSITLTAAFIDLSPHIFCHLHASPPHNPNHAANTGVLTFELYEARVPGNPQPHGPLLASTSIGAHQLPAGTVMWWDTIALQAVAPPAGVAWGWWNSNAHVIPINIAPTAPVTIGLAGMGAVVEPGRAYTLVVRLTGRAEVTLATTSRANAVQSEVALKRAGESVRTPQALDVPRSLAGTRTFTQTSEHAAVSSVGITLQPARAAPITGSASVSGQMVAPDAWTSVVPGEVPVLEQSGS